MKNAFRVLVAILIKIEICGLFVNTWLRYRNATLLNTNPGEALIIRNSIGAPINLQVSQERERISDSLHLVANPPCLFVPHVTSYTISVSAAPLI